jgi:hypothetical protein
MTVMPPAGGARIRLQVQRAKGVIPVLFKLLYG